MGNFEKLVVLTVLFLAAIILGVSLHDDGSVRSNDPLAGTVLEDPVAQSPTPKPEASRPVLSSLVEQPEVETPAVSEQPVVQPEAVPVVKPEPKVEAPTRSLFRTTVGLVKPEFGEDFLLYTWQEGDTIAAIAERYYGDRKLRYLIRNNNEDAEFRTGDLINLPYVDTAADAGSRPAYEPAPAHEAPKVVIEPARDVQTYTVKDGDSLWGIAVKAYGKGTQWESIFKANRDQMTEPTDLKPGMVLRIP